MSKIDILGDPHLGRTFLHGVPLHRRGDREEMMWEDFEKSVLDPKGSIHVCMGDLFDKPIVPFSVIVRAAQTYMEAPKDVEYIILRGNHDASRDLQNPSAFDVFSMIVEGHKNIHVVKDYYELENMQFYGWQPLGNASDYVKSAKGVDTAFGHWDLIGTTHNLIPTTELAAVGITTVYNGHIHKRETLTRDGLTINVVGSMQPYAHGEGDLYVTVSLTDLLADPDKYKNMCVRVDLKEGEVLDTDVDCLQLVISRPEVGSSIEPVQMATFDLTVLFNKAFDELEVDPEIRELVLKEFECRKT